MFVPLHGLPSRPHRFISLSPLGLRLMLFVFALFAHWHHVASVPRDSISPRVCHTRSARPRASAALGVDPRRRTHLWTMRQIIPGISEPLLLQALTFSIWVRVDLHTFSLG